MRIAVLILIILVLIFLHRLIRPNGMLHIDVYTNKDSYRMLYFTPLDKLKKHRYLILKVETQQWPNESVDFYEDFEF